MEKKEFVARYLIALIGQYGTTDSITRAEIAWAVFEKWMAAQGQPKGKK